MDEIQKRLEKVNERLRDHPDDHIARLNKGAFLIYLGRYYEGFACMNQVEKAAIHENNTDILEKTYLSKGSSASWRGKDKDALAHYKKALKLNPDSGIAHFLIGGVLSNMKKFEDAIHHYDQAIQLQYVNANVHYEKAHTLTACEKHAAALKCLKEALREQPDHVEAHYMMGNIYLELGKPRRAIKCLKKAIQINPHHIITHMTIATAYTITKQYRLAKSHMDMAVKLAPKDRDVLKLQTKLKERYGLG